MRVVGWVAVVLVAGVALGTVAVGANSISDIKRYLRMRSM
jgi:hypothetical protein